MQNRITHKQDITTCLDCGNQYSCPHCKADNDTRIPLIAYLWLFIVITCILTFIVYCVDAVSYNGKYLNAIQYSSECDFKMPKKYEVVTDGESYAIKVNDSYSKDDYYIVQGRYGLKESWTTIYEPATFTDSCIAKGALKELLEDNSNRAAAFK